jgi:hypothetical protein
MRISIMGRRPVGEVPMTPAERQRRRRAKLREIVHVEQVLANLERDYVRAGVNKQPAIRAGMKKLLTRWEKNAAARRRAMRILLSPASKWKAKGHR